MNRRPVKFVDDLGEHLTSAVTSVQNDWREQLTGVVAVTKDVAEGLGEILMGINQIEANTDKLDEMLADDSSQSEGGRSLSSSTSEEIESDIQTRPSKGPLGSKLMPRSTN